MSRGGGLRPKPEIGNRNVPLHNSNPSLDNPPESRPTREPPRKRDTSPAGTEIQELVTLSFNKTSTEIGLKTGDPRGSNPFAYPNAGSRGEVVVVPPPKKTV